MPKPTKKALTRANAGHEAQLWQIADVQRGRVDAAERNHGCLGLLFLKYIPNDVQEAHAARPLTNANIAGTMAA